MGDSPKKRKIAGKHRKDVIIDSDIVSVDINAPETTTNVPTTTLTNDPATNTTTNTETNTTNTTTNTETTTTTTTTNDPTATILTASNVWEAVVQRSIDRMNAQILRMIDENGLATRADIYLSDHVIPKTRLVKLIRYFRDRGFKTRFVRDGGFFLFCVSW